jgi:dTDP-glucose 4,6-dehydratase
MNDLLKNIKTIIVTGGAGFIGSHFVKLLLKKYPDIKIINYDKLTYAGSKENLPGVENNPNYSFVKGDVSDFNLLDHLMKDADAIIHFAAESHVDNSFGDSIIYTESNTHGTHTIMEVARKNKLKRILHVSTDEVYGEKDEGSFVEDDKLDPNNPYSASKAAAEMIVSSYHKAYNMPIVIVRGNNAYGPNQYPEKIIPKFSCLLMEDRQVPVHGDGMNIRTYIHVEDFCSAVETVFWKGKEGEVYNIGTNDEISNIDLTKKIIKQLGKEVHMIKFVKDRPFNDKRYSVENKKLLALGWKQEHNFEEGLQETIKWYQSHEDWWKPRLAFELARKRDEKPR